VYYDTRKHLTVFFRHRIDLFRCQQKWIGYSRLVVPFILHLFHQPQGNVGVEFLLASNISKQVLCHGGTCNGYIKKWLYGTFFPPRIEMEVCLFFQSVLQMAQASSSLNVFKPD